MANNVFNLEKHPDFFLNHQNKIFQTEFFQELVI